MIIEISVAVIACAFVFLVIFLIILARAAVETSRRINEILIDARKNLDQFGGQASKVIEHTNHVTYDLKRKMESLDPFFNSISNVGDVFENKSAHFKKRHLYPSENEHEISKEQLNEKLEEKLTEKLTEKLAEISQDKLPLHQHALNKIAEFFELAGIGIRLWQKLKKRR